MLNSHHKIEISRQKRGDKLNILFRFVLHIVLIVLSIFNAVSNKEKSVKVLWIISCVCWVICVILDAIRIFL